MPNLSATPGHLNIPCSPLTGDQIPGLIQRAYVYFDGGHDNPFRVAPVIGGPAWLRTELFRIDAKAEGNAAMPVMAGPMLQNLLEDRFHLRLHRESVEGPVYQLTAPKGTGKLPAFEPDSCVPESESDDPPDLPQGRHYCRTFVLLNPASVRGEGITITEFIGLLNFVVDRPVIDKTGLPGRFNIRIDFTADSSTPGLHRPLPSAPAAAADPAPDVFQALEQQLGLKLTPARGPTGRIVIDHVERPTAN